MVNYKFVVCEVILALLIATAASAPFGNDDHYDQRQNGTENYRLNIDGIVLAMVPADAISSAVSEIDIEDLLEEFNELQKPKPPSESLPPKPIAQPDIVKPQESKPDSAEKPEAPLSDVTLNEKPNAPLSDVTVNSEIEGQKKDAGRKPIGSQRLKGLFSSMVLPFLRRHEN